MYRMCVCVWVFLASHPILPLLLLPSGEAPGGAVDDGLNESWPLMQHTITRRVGCSLEKSPNLLLVNPEYP